MFGLGYITGAVSTVGGLVKKAGQKLIEKAEEYLEKPMKMIKGFRDSIRAVILSTALEYGTPSIKTGAKIDKTAADVASAAKDVFGANKVDEVEGRTMAELRVKLEKKLSKISNDLNRLKSDDEKLMVEEAAIEKDWATAVTTESGPETQQTSPGDEKFSREVVSFFNTMRKKEGADGFLKIDKEMTEEAKKRAALITNRGDQHLTPYRYLRVPPLTRKNNIVKEGTGVVMSGKYPRFPESLSEEERDRVNKIEWDEKTGTYKALLNETDQAFAVRIREAKAKRDAFQVTNLNFTFDLKDESYPFDSDPRRILERLCKDDVVKKTLLLNVKKIGIGIHRDGTKVVMSFIITNETPPEDAIEAPVIERPQDYSCNEFWMKQIDEKKKLAKPPPQAYSIQELYDRNESDGKPAFRSGYSLYEYSLFRDQIEKLKAQGLHVDILKVEFYPNEAINDRRYHTLHIPLDINGSKTEIRLIMGTNVVAYPKSVGDSEMTGGLSDFAPLSEYLEKITKKLEPRQLRFPEGEMKEKVKPAITTAT